ncbi:MAG TPA: hypothetical protein VKC34_10210 [Blastocatellia bacterium]|nr:hypothetical protein [Blastocatellia bacterium]
MSDNDCPICHTRLELTDVAPCMECGNDPHEVEHAIARRHTYAEMRIFGDVTLVLCGFCQVDFGAFNPTFFGLSRESLLEFREMEFLSAVEEIYIRRDSYCPRCGYRLPFLSFIQKVRELNGVAGGRDRA